MRALVGAAWLSARGAIAGDAPRPPLPEPIFTETVTDLDGDEAGELEVELNASSFRAPRGGAADVGATIEIEYMLTRRLGLRLEPGLTRARGGARGEPGSPRRADRSFLGVMGAASWKLLHDFPHDAHLQHELAARAPFDTVREAVPGDPALPLVADLRGGVRVARWTVRAGAGVEAGGRAASAPIRGSFAVLTGFAASERHGFWGVELDADAARPHPLLVAANAVADCTPVGLPFRIGVAVPVALDAPRGDPSLGLFVRVFFVSEREVDYGRSAEGEGGQVQ